MATVVRVRGARTGAKGRRCSSVRDGTYECALSGGCLEPTVAEAAARVIATGEPVVVSYDLADDSIWGLGIGCSGAVDIRIERLDDDEMTTRMAGDSRARRGRGARHAAGRRVGPAASCRATRQRRRPERSGGSSRRRSRAPARACAQVPASGPERIGRAELFFEVNLPAPELVVFGAGHDAVPLAQLAWALGFAVTIVDVREAFLTADRFPNATLVLRALQPIRERRAAARRQFRARDEPSPRTRPGEPALRPRVGRGLYRCARAPCALRELLAGLAEQGYTASASSWRACATPSVSRSALKRRRSRPVDSGGNARHPARLRRRLPQRVGRQPSPPRRHTSRGALVVVRRIDVDEKIRRKLQDGADRA